MEEKIREELYSKLESEFNSYKKELETLTSKEIIDKSYETTMKEELNINQLLEDNTDEIVAELAEEYKAKQSKKKSKER